MHSAKVNKNHTWPNQNHINKINSFENNAVTSKSNPKENNVTFNLARDRLSDERIEYYL